LPGSEDRTAVYEGQDSPNQRQGGESH
jgi:hypothetical protein